MLRKIIIKGTSDDTFDLHLFHFWNLGFNKFDFGYDFAKLFKFKADKKLTLRGMRARGDWLSGESYPGQSCFSRFVLLMRVLYPGGGGDFLLKIWITQGECLPKSNIFPYWSLVSGQWPRRVEIMKKNGGRKSHCAFPLKSLTNSSIVMQHFPSETSPPWDRAGGGGSWSAAAHRWAAWPASRSDWRPGPTSRSPRRQLAPAAVLGSSFLAA